MSVLCTDAGHGGPDSGAVWRGVREKDLNLAFTLLLNRELKQRGHQIYTTRKSDRHVPPLGIRCRLINAHHRRQAPAFDAIVSIHCNVAVTRDPDTGEYQPLPSRRGLYVIYSRESALSTQLAGKIAEQCASREIALSHRGLLSTLELGRTLAWIHKTIPTAVLIELGFMTNPDELQLLQSNDYRMQLVAAIADGIDEYLQSQDNPEEIS